MGSEFVNLVVQRNPYVKFTIKDDGSYMVYNPKVKRMQIFNSEAAKIWEEIDGVRTIDEVINAAFGENQVSRDEVEVNSFIGFFETLLDLDYIYRGI